MAKYRIQRKVPTAAFGGSLIQQNHGETLHDHGFLIWDVNTRSNEFVEVKNNYGFVTLDIKEGKILNEPSVMPEHPRLRLRVYETSGSQLKECLIEIRKKYNPEEVSINRGVAAEIQDGQTERFDLTNVRDVNFQNTLIADYLSRNLNGVDEALLKRIYEINTTLNSKLPVVDIARNVIWKPKTFKFANMFSYGEGNVIDFTKLSGNAGIFSPNASGKSAILEALSFCLFDKCSKDFKAINILNNRKTEFWCELNFEIDGVDYFIKRIAVKKNENSAPEKVEFYRILPNGEEEDLNGDARRATSSIIRSYIGEYDDFALTAMSAQDSSDTNFIRKSQTDRKELLMQFLDINIFDTLFNIGNNEIKDYTALLKKYEARSFDNEIVDIDAMAAKFANEHKLLTIAKSSLVKTMEVYNSEILELTKQQVPIHSVPSDVSSLEKKRDTIKSKMAISESNLVSIKQRRKENLDTAVALNQRISSLKELKVKERYDELQELESEKNSVQSDMNKLKVEMSHAITKIEKLKTLEYNPDCEACKRNISIVDADLVQTHEKLAVATQSAKECKAKYQELAGKIADLSGIEDEYKVLSDCEKQFNSLHMKGLQLQTDGTTEENRILAFKNDLVVIENDIAKYYKSKETIENNIKIDAKIRTIKKELAPISDELKDIEEKELEASSKILFYTDKKAETIKEMQNFHDVEEKVRAYQYYLEAISKDGIPYELIAKSIPAIEAEINNILSQVTDFVVHIELDKKNIYIKIVYDEYRSWPAEMASGMEKFIIGLAIRVALTNVSHLPRPNFISIDEGFTALDADNLSNLPTVFDYLRHHYDFSLIISHLDEIRDFVDVILDLQKDSDDYSKIVFK